MRVLRTTLAGLAPLFGSAAVCLASCTDSTTTAPPAHSTARVDQVETSSAPPPSAALPPPVPEAPPAPWVQAVRVGRWSEAASLLDALVEGERQKPEIRFVRARVAAELGDHAKAVELLTGLVPPPLLATDVEAARAESAAEAGPFADAAKYFAKGTRPRDLVRAGRAYEKAGDTAAASEVLDRAVSSAERLRRWSDERAARGLRWKLHAKAGKPGAGIGDLEWLATEGAATPDGKAAREELDRRKQKLRPRQNKRAIEVLVEAGEATAATALLERDDAGLSRAERLHLKAQALYKARKWSAAVDALKAAGKVKSGRTAEQLYTLGRALARLDKTEEADAVWADVAKRFGSTDWGDRATYQRARTHLSSGRYEGARDGFVAYLSKYPRGAMADDAAYELALAYLSTKEPAEARKRFGDMANKAKNLDVGIYRELEGVAAQRAGDVDGAKRIWADVSRRQPLTWAALTARARLVAAGAEKPPLFEQGGGGPLASPILVTLPGKAALLSSLGLDEDAEAWIEQNEQSIAGPYAGRESEALCAMYAKLSRAKRRYKVGTAAVSFDALMKAPGPADRWGWECVYPRPYEDTVGALEKERSVPKGLVHALMRQESGFDPEIASPVGAKGLLQLMPTTAQEAAKEASVSFSPELVTVPDVNIALGGFYISKLLGTFQGSVPLAVASYNAGPGAVSTWLKKGVETEADVWVARIPYDETRNYVARVMGNLARYQWLSGGEEAVSEITLEVPLVKAPDDAY